MPRQTRRGGPSGLSSALRGLCLRDILAALRSIVFRSFLHNLMFAHPLIGQAVSRKVE